MRVSPVLRRALLLGLTTGLLGVLASAIPPEIAQAQDRSAPATPVHTWLPMISMLALQAVAFAYYTGKQATRIGGLEAANAQTREALSSIVRRLDTLDDFTGQSSTDRATLRQELNQIRANSEGLGMLREEFVIQRATVSQDLRQMRDTSERQSRRITNVARQVQELALRRGPTVIPFDDAGDTDA